MLIIQPIVGMTFWLWLWQIWASHLTGTGLVRNLAKKNKDLPSGYVKIAIENCYLLLIYLSNMWIFQFATLVYQEDKEQHLWFKMIKQQI